DDRAIPDVGAAAGEHRVARQRLPRLLLGAEADVADGLLLGAAVGAGDPCDRAGDIGAEALERPVAHRHGDLRRDRALALDQGRADPEKLRLRLVRISHHATRAPPPGTE